MKLTPEDFEKLETKELANIIRKLGAGGTLTKREEEKLQNAKTKSDPAAAEEKINFVATWDELARVLTQRIGIGVSRKSLQNWRDPEKRSDLANKWPRDRADGRKDVSAWVRFVVGNGLNRADEILEDDEVDGDRKTVRDWKMYREELMCNDLERKIARGDGLLLVAADLEVPMGATFVAINAKLQQFPARSARFLVMCRDEATAESKLRDEMDAVLKDLNAADYIDASIDEVINEFPFDDDETAALYAKVSFDGHDQAGFLELIRRSVEESLRRIGRKSLAQPTADTLDAEPQSPQAKADDEEMPAGKMATEQKEKAHPPREVRPVTRRGKRGAATSSKRKLP